jgi:chemotaxis regulatin CheY-phosphate phosphatase CheZ
MIAGISMSAMIPHAREDALAFETIEAAVKETGRGRWFLDEYARRNRHADTLVILATLETIQSTLAARTIQRGGENQASATLERDILDIGRALARTQRDIRAIRAAGEEQFISASDALGGVVQTTEKATSAILSAAERVQEYAWILREKNGDQAEYDILDACASEIYTACTFQDITAQRITKVVDAVRFIDERIATMVKSMGLATALQQDLAAEEEAIRITGEIRASDIWMSEAHQAEIDETFEFFTPAEIIAEPTMVGGEVFDNVEAEANPAFSAPPPEPEGSDHAGEEGIQTLLTRVEEMQSALAPSDDAQEALSAYEGLSTEERLRSFR